MEFLSKTVDNHDTRFWYRSREQGLHKIWKQFALYPLPADQNDKDMICLTRTLELVPLSQNKACLTNQLVLLPCGYATILAWGTKQDSSYPEERVWMVCCVGEHKDT